MGSTGYLARHRIDAGQNVAQIAVAEVLAIGLGKGLALAVAAARIGLEHKIAERREGRRAEPAATAPMRNYRGRGATVHDDDQRIFLGGIVVFGQHEPALDVEVIALPREETDLPQAGSTPSFMCVSGMHAFEDLSS